MGIYTHEQVIRTTSDCQTLLNLSLTIGFDSNSDTTGASASALIASATTRVRRLHDMTQSGMQAIRSCMYSYMNACMYVHLQHHAYEDHGSNKQAVLIQVSSSRRRGHALRPRNTVLLRRFLTSTSTGSTPTTSTRALDFVKLRPVHLRLRVHVQAI